jgi:tetratricopeptide (TPR) repeat protein
MLGEGWSLVRLGRSSEARTVATELATIAPDDVEVLMLNASVHSETGDPASALTVLHKARRVAPMRADIQERIGDIARSLGDHEGAVAAYRHALQLDNDFAVVRVQLALLLEAKGLVRDAEQELIAALDAVPTYGQAALELAGLRRRLGRPNEALLLLVELLQRDPTHLNALIVLGETLLELGRRTDAFRAFARVLRFDPNHVGALYQEGVLLAEQRRYGDAIERWQRVIELGPSTDYARRARRESRSASDLQRIFAARGDGS